MKQFQQALHFFEDYFVPTHRNRHLPHGLSRSAFLFFLLIGVTLFASSAVLSVTSLATPAEIINFTADEVLRLVNAARKETGLGELALNPKLSEAALTKAQDMLSRQYFAHVTPDGKQPWTFLQTAQYSYIAAGENLAIDFHSADSAHRALMNSPSHRANILNPMYQEAGVSVLPGEFEGRQSILVVQFFGKPRQMAPIANVAAATPTPVPSISSKPTVIPPVVVAGVSITPEPTRRTSILPATTLTEGTDPEAVNRPAASVSRPDRGVDDLSSLQFLMSGFENIAESIAGSTMIGTSFVRETRVLALLVIALMMLPLFFSLNRMRHHPRIYVRPLVVIALFVYLGWFGGVLEPVSAKITPSPAQTACCEPIMY